MHPVIVRNIKIGEGIPKICVPIIGSARQEIRSAAEKLVRVPADMAEWRADWFADVFDLEQVKETLAELRAILQDIPLLFTFRTAKEGGEKEIDTETYVNLNRAAIHTGCVDLVDAELFSGGGAVQEILDAAHSCGVKVIVSSHDFQKTPRQDEMVERLVRMQKLGADIPKIAVMPQNKKDVLALLAATEEMYAKHADRPFISMSMGSIGAVSRFCGGLFGSSVTFGTAGAASAPGQADAGELAQALLLLHRHTQPKGQS